MTITAPPRPQPPVAAAQASTKPDGPAISRQRLGTRLRQLREAHGLHLADATDTLGVAPSTLSRIETGRAPTRTSYLHVLLDLYQVTDPDERRALADLARHGQCDNWWTAAAAAILPPGADRCIGLEDAAAAIRTYAIQTIPDLLQAPGYAAAAARAARPGLNPGYARQLAELTARRQQVLHWAPFALHAVLDEAALLRPPGDPALMVSQLDHLADLAAAPQVTVQVLPLTAAAPVLSPPFTLYTLNRLPDTACTTSHAGQHHTTTRPTATTTMNTAFTALAKAALAPAESAALIRHHADHPHCRT
jgi:transcriptional regulator with XRE-family HTH domain